MLIRFAVTTLTLAALCAGATERPRPYSSSVSDMELEDGVKGVTYNDGPVNYLAGVKKGGSSKCCCPCEGAPSVKAAPAEAPKSAPPSSSSSGPSKDSGPAPEEPVVSPPVTPTTPAAPTATEPPPSEADLNLAIKQLGTSSWRDAQALLVGAGKAAIPLLIDNVNNAGTAYNLGGHTKADAGRALRQRTIGEVCAELLADIVLNHTGFTGEVPGTDQNAWREWWAKNGGSATVAGH